MPTKKLSEKLTGKQSVIDPKIDTSIATQFLETVFHELIKSEKGNELIAPFIRKPIFYGRGIQQLSIGFLPVEDFDPDERYPADANMIQTHREVITDEMRMKYRLTINDILFRKLFKNAENHSKWIAMLKNNLSKSVNMDMVNMARYIFGVNKSTFPKPLTANMITELDKIKTALANGEVVETPEKSTLSMIKTIITESKRLEQSPSKDNMFSSPTLADGSRVELPVNISIDKQVCIMSWKLWNKFVIDEKANVYHPEFYNLPENLTIIQADIPENKVYIIDPNLINFYPRFKVVNQVDYANTLEKDIIQHVWYKLGTFPTTAGKIIRMKA